MQRLVALCEQTGRPFRTVPQLKDLMRGQVSVNQLRPVSIEDLLGATRSSSTGRDTRGPGGRVVLVTGGRRLDRRRALPPDRALRPERLLIADSCEYNLYRIEPSWPSATPSLRVSAGCST
jgi:FlaA1/EpsC-like NDP-sugar epimerase